MSFVWTATGVLVHVAGPDPAVTLCGRLVAEEADEPMVGDVCSRCREKANAAAALRQDPDGTPWPDLDVGFR